MSTDQPNNGGPVRRRSYRRDLLELGGVSSMVAAGATVSVGTGLVALSVSLLWLAWSVPR